METSYFYIFSFVQLFVYQSQLLEMVVYEGLNRFVWMEECIGRGSSDLGRLL